MKIECLTGFKDLVEGAPTEFFLADVCTVADADGARFCANGWAKDLAGKVATAEPTGGSKTLEVHNLTLGQSAPTAGE